MVSPQASWLTYSRHMEQACLLDALSLGVADARLSRGETVLHHLHMSVEDLSRLGFEECSPMLSLQDLRHPGFKGGLLGRFQIPRIFGRVFSLHSVQAK